MPDAEVKEVSMISSTGEETKTRKRRPRKNKTQRAVDKTDIKGEAIVKTEEVIITQKGTEKPKGIKVETQQVFKLVPKSAPSAIKKVPVPAPAPAPAPSPAPAPAKTKVTILPKTKKMQKITIVGKSVKKGPPPAVKQKITLPSASHTKKTRKFYKERRLRIEL
jgi:hypothetical protein